MKTRSGVQNGRSETACKRLQSVHVAAIVFFLAAALPLSAQEKQDSGVVRPGIDSGTIGFIASKRAGAKEVGLPWYPGARPHQDKSDDSPAFQLGLWGGAWGFKLVGLKLESNDTPEKITAFYRKALAKYGRVRNCADSTNGAAQQGRTASADEPDCQDEHPESGETLLQAGTKEKKHIVDIRTESGLSVFQLLYVEAPPSEGSQ
ncbi:MAG: hypothetical protein ACLQVL_30045 [Terriglobia bacterium]